MSDEARTLVDERGGVDVLTVPRFNVTVTRGPDAGKSAQSQDGRLVVGGAEGVDLRLSDKLVSRFHLELAAGRDGIHVRDLSSTNGSYAAQGLRLADAVATRSCKLRVGQNELSLELASSREDLAASREQSFGALVGGSPAMRGIYATLARVAPTDAIVLITGETGTGKEVAARAVHEASSRAAGPFEVVDCGGLPPTLIESELFGHARGAFTGADRKHVGAFERAQGGTLFLDELGELPLALQPKLLRALGEGQIRPLGGDWIATDVRIIAATNRDLRREVNGGRFRADLYYRLAVIRVHLPPLRERREDLPLLVKDLLSRIASERNLPHHVEPDEELIAELARHDWPGNVRELANYLEQLLVLQLAPPLGDDATGTADSAPQGDGDLVALPWRTAKQRAVERFERRYLEAILEETDGNVAAAARRAGVDRTTLFRSLRRLGIDRDG